jgi:hypothetical protein
MKIEILRIEKLGQDNWYELHLDGKYITGSYNLEKINDMKESIKLNPSCIGGKTILTSEIIDVSL